MTGGGTTLRNDGYIGNTAVLTATVAAVAAAAAAAGGRLVKDAEMSCNRQMLAGGAG